jgi:hypothetical protein
MDGQVRFVPLGTDAATVRAMLTTDGGEEFAWPGDYGPDWGLFLLGVAELAFVLVVVRRHWRPIE